MRIFILATFVLSVSFGTPFFVNAQTQTPAPTTIAPQVQTPAPTTVAPNTNTGTNVTLLNPLSGVDCSRGNGNCLSSFLLNILDFVITIGSIVVILMLVLVGFKFVVAQGVPGKIEEARTMLLWTVIGALVLLGSKAIAMGVQATIRALGG